MKPLKKIYVEITNGCNLQCSFCAPSGRKIRTMSAAEFSDVARQIVPFTDYVCLHIKGEPLAHPELEAVFAICKEQGLAVNLTTNGTLLSRQAQLLCSADALRQINISLHAETADPEQYFTQAVAFAKQGAARRKYISFRLWNGGEGQGLQQRLYDLFPGHYEKGGRITLAPNLFLSLDSLWQWPDIHGPFVSNTGTCHGLKNQLGILSDGTVVPCCLDGEGAAPLGNLFDTAFDILWETKVKPHRDSMKNHKLSLSLCTKCHFREKFAK